MKRKDFLKLPLLAGVAGGLFAARTQEKPAAAPAAKPAEEVKPVILPKTPSLLGNCTPSDPPMKKPAPFVIASGCFPPLVAYSGYVPGQAVYLIARAENTLENGKIRWRWEKRKS